LHREITAVCSENHAKHTNTLFGQKVQLLNVNPGGSYIQQAVGLITLVNYSKRETV